MSYRELQREAKATGLPARQTAAKLREQLASHRLAEQLASPVAATAAMGSDTGTTSPRDFLSPAAALALQSGDVHIVPNFVPPLLLAGLREEIRTLASAGAFQAAASFSSDGSQDTLRSALTCRPDLSNDSMWALYDKLQSVRDELVLHGRRRLAAGIEATFVVYPPGGYYRKHVDSLGAAVDPEGSGRRSVSFVAYLTEGGWSSEDGGCLRVHCEGAGGPTRDILPRSGSLVLFDSRLVWHEVRPTQRERACLVGWFRNML